MDTFEKMENSQEKKITGAELIAIGFEEGKAIGMVLDIIETHFSGVSVDKIQTALINFLKDPEEYMDSEVFGDLSKEFLFKEENATIDLRETPLDYRVYGAEGIEEGALKQINTAMRLPVAKAGALMPDAHQGYGLPIGGVLATENAVIPYAVGVDIGCRMCMTIYDFPEDTLETRKEDLKKMLKLNTAFGRKTMKKPKDDEVLANPLFKEIKVIKDLKERAAAQIGSSGGGNHFVEFGVTEILDPNNEWGIAPGKYLAVLSHSGSRGFGANIARYYTKLAMEKCQLPKEARHLAWLDLNTEEGMEYWLAMNLAGDYASACHHHIHERMAVGLRAKPLAMIENHHNFAWKEKDAQGNEIIVHRKGATPAGKGVLGIIPGSMTAPGFIVRGKGDENSVNSASHGAGRCMSRTAAKNNLNATEVIQYLRDHGVEVIGSGLDEAPMAYKNIEQVMAAQSDLVEVIGKFLPKIVRMCGDEKFKEVD
ncbi:MAG: RtcB family protein [Flavobacteriales bacterium]|nr:RtcB family protein [Flavobacteriales bacterium]